MNMHALSAPLPVHLTHLGVVGGHVERLFHREPRGAKLQILYKGKKRLRGIGERKESIGKAWHAHMRAMPFFISQLSLLIHIHRSETLHHQRTFSSRK